MQVVLLYLFSVFFYSKAMDHINTKPPYPIHKSLSTKNSMHIILVTFLLHAKNVQIEWYNVHRMARGQNVPNRLKNLGYFRV
jgi:multidrug transporter EmrE-like cation transporter